MRVRLLACLALLAAFVCAIAAAPSFAANPINVQISPANQTVATTARGCVTVKATDSVTGQPVVADFQLIFHIGAVGSRLEPTVPVRTDGAGNGSACVNPPDRTPNTATVTLYENGIVVYAGTASGSSGTGNTATIRWSNGTTPTAPPGLVLSAETSQASVVAGGQVKLVLDLANTSTGLLTETTLSTTLPGGAEVVSATFDGGACDGGANCTAGGIEPGAHNKAILVFRAAAPGKLAFAFSARARAGPNAFGAGAGYQTRTASVSVDVQQRVADVSVKLTAPATKPAVGKLVRTTAVVTNRGRDDAPLTAVDLTVPAGLKLVGLTSTQGRCASRRCTFDVFAPAATVRIVILLRPTKAAKQTLVVRAASGQASDPAAANNVARLTLRPVPPK